MYSNLFLSFYIKYISSHWGWTSIIICNILLTVRAHNSQVFARQIEEIHVHKCVSQHKSALNIFTIILHQFRMPHVLLQNVEKEQIILPNERMCISVYNYELIPTIYYE